MLKDRDVFLFDLDGTLLNIEVDEFLKYYFGALSQKFNDLCENQDQFIKVLSKSTEKMIKNDGSKTNQQAFMEDFMQRIGIKEKKEARKIKERFDNFYQREFTELDKYFELDKETPSYIINYLKRKGKKLVLATNPLFPVEAVEARLKWVNIDPNDFELITNYENMSYAKPNPDYYKEILEKISENPENCLMVGNDLSEDAVASKLGIKTLIIENKLIERRQEDKKADLNIAWQGSLNEFKNLIEEKIK